MAIIYVRVHRAPSGDYWSEVTGDIDALVGVSVINDWPEHIVGKDDEGETVYQNDAAIDLWEDYQLHGGPYPLTTGNSEEPEDTPKPWDGHRFQETDTGMPCEECGYGYSVHSDR